ncbi:MAG: aminotransferase class I/II-fold pyridoxal phosphate-dependent enzyme [Oscillospiraceae bacterium]|nr:aminotransferase class I/II-fold pyridoxal phosphate-dependent enzyme [Oscillospiraceae bacterium]
MIYDFTSIIERKGRDAIALDGAEELFGKIREGFDQIPMWVADMNFPACPTIPETIIERTKHPCYGYFEPREEYYEAILRWQKKRNNVTGLEKGHIGYQNGVLGGVISTLKVLCSAGDSVLIHSPTYIGFTEALSANGYRIVHSPLKKDPQGIWRMNLSDMEQRLKENHIHAAIFCSPHNPCGRVWEREEIQGFMELCRKYNVYVISDEIWSDLILPGYTHTPTQSVSEDARERTVALYAPSKTFNLAGLVGSYHIIYNKWLRERVEREASLSHYNEMNLLSMYALLGAYGPEGEQWLEQLRQVLEGNVDYACTYIKEHFKGVEVSRPQGTYMLFLDCSGWCREHGKSIDQVQKAGWEVGVLWQDGRPFHGPCHIRMNLALPLSRVQEAFERLDQYVFNG